MEIRLQMTFAEDSDSGRLPSCWLLGFYPGALQKGFEKGNHWLEWMDDKSVLPIAHLMERAFRLNKIVVFRKPDEFTQKLLGAHRKRAKMDAKISVSVRHAGGGGQLWQGNYGFDFFIEKMIANQSDEEGNRWETLQLKIIDRTESIELPE